MEIVSVKGHEQGSLLVVVSQDVWRADQKGDPAHAREDVTYLKKSARSRSLDWYTWPACRPVEYAAMTKLGDAFDAYETRRQFNPRPEVASPKAKLASSVTCVYCRSPVTELVVSCRACSSALHLACANESGGRRLTPGCVHG